MLGNNDNSATNTSNTDNVVVLADYDIERLARATGVLRNGAR